MPVDGFWSVTVYNKDGYFTDEPAERVLAQQHHRREGMPTDRWRSSSADATGLGANCLPITPGWNYLVRLYRPRAEILDGSWTFPEAQPV